MLYHGLHRIIRKDDEMSDNEGWVKIPKKKRLPMDSNAKPTKVNIPAYLLKIIDEEAKIKGKTRSNVIAYLILAGLKAHVGQFIKPANNTIKENYIKRGGRW
jgi:hypothetical protein